MSDEHSVSRWICGLRDGDSVAGREIWQRYFERLLLLARRKLGTRAKRVADEEDIVVEAFDSFLRGVLEGRFAKLDDREDLWQVLVMITARKASNQVKHDLRLRRGGGDVRGESIFGDGTGWAGIDGVVGSEPTPELAEGLTEECKYLLDQLADETLRTVALARLQGYTNDEIAAQLNVKTRTVERKLQLIRDTWSKEASGE